jgi:hypothetical protein
MGVYDFGPREKATLWEKEKLYRFAFGTFNENPIKNVLSYLQSRVSTIVRGWMGELSPMRNAPGDLSAPIECLL